MKTTKKILYGLLLSQLIILSLPQLIAAETLVSQPISSSNDLIPCADKIDWQYKLIDNVLCRRLFNYTTGTPVTDWEPVP